MSYLLSIEILLKQNKPSPSIDALILHFQFCYVSSGAWSEWQSWGACSQSCPGGKRIRTRSHTCSGATQNQSMLCGENPGFSEWGPWTACSRTCGGGTQYRTRTNVCGVGLPETQNRFVISVNLSELSFPRIYSKKVTSQYDQEFVFFNEEYFFSRKTMVECNYI